MILLREDKRINVIRDTYVIGEPTIYNFSLLIKSKLTKSRIQRLINQKLSEEIFGDSVSKNSDTGTKELCKKPMELRK